MSDLYKEHEGLWDSEYITIKEYTTSGGKSADYMIDNHTTYDEAVLEDIEALKADSWNLHTKEFRDTIDGLDADELEGLYEQAKASIQKRLENYKKNLEVERLRHNLTFDSDKQCYYLFGLVAVETNVELPSEGKARNKRNLTVAKDIINNELLTPLFKNFKLDDTWSITQNQQDVVKLEKK